MSLKGMVLTCRNIKSWSVFFLNMGGFLRGVDALRPGSHAPAEDRGFEPCVLTGRVPATGESPLLPRSPRAGGSSGSSGGSVFTTQRVPSPSCVSLLWGQTATGARTNAWAC